MTKTTEQQKLTDAQKRFKELDEIFQSKGKYTESELKEWTELCDFLGGISIECQKKIETYQLRSRKNILLNVTTKKI